MKHPVYFVGIAVLLGMVLFGCGKSKKQSVDEVNSSDSGKVAVQVPEMPDISGIVLDKPVFDKKKAAKPVRLSPAALMGLEAVTLENAVMRSFGTAVAADGENVLKMRKAADLGNEEACEKLALYYLAFPKTDSRYDLGKQYLLKIENYRSQEALLTRALMEYHSQPGNADKAKPYFERAMADAEESTLQWILAHEDIGLFEQAWEKLHRIYEDKSAAMDVEATFRLAELYDVYPAKRDLEKFESYLKQAVAQSYGPACYVYALMLISQHKDSEGLNMLKKAAELNVDEANSMLSSLYLVVLLKDSAESASEYAHRQISPELYQLLKSEVSSHPETGKETIGDLFKIAEYAKNSHGTEQGCKVLFAIAGSGEWAQSVTDDAIDCVKQFVTKSESRLACDSIDGMFPFKSEDLYTKTFNPEQRRKMTSLIIECYENVMVAGQDYVLGNLKVLSAATKLGVIYSGEIDENVDQDDVMSRQYMVYAAKHDDDIVAQMSLAQDYLNGEFFGKQSHERACYWSTRVAQHHECQELCKTTKTEYGEELVLDENLSEADVGYIVMICSVCRSADEVLSTCGF